MALPAAWLDCVACLIKHAVVLVCILVASSRPTHAAKVRFTLQSDNKLGNETVITSVQFIENHSTSSINTIDSKSVNHPNASGWIIPRNLANHPNASGWIIPRQNSNLLRASDVIIPRTNSFSDLNLKRFKRRPKYSPILKDSQADPLSKQLSPSIGCGAYGIAPGTILNFQTKNYPKPYPRWHKCSWTFTGVTDNLELELDCQDFHLPLCRKGSWRRRRRCLNRNYFLVRSQTDQRRYRGTLGPQHILLEGNKLSLTLRTQFPAKGFSCSVRAISTVPTETTSSVDPSDCGIRGNTKTSGCDEYMTSNSETPSTSTTTQPIKSCRCGVTYERIVGGVVTGVNEFPWHVGLVRVGSRTPFCGASIVGRRHVLTAAHCTQARSFSLDSSIRTYKWRVEAMVGAHHISATSNTPYLKRIPLDSIVQHPHYNSNTLRHDVSLIKLASPLDLHADPRLAPVCLPAPQATNLYVGANAVVSGWGRLTEGGTQPQALQKVWVPVISNEDCERSYPNAIFTESLCAGYPEGGHDACQGDSGGPLVTEEDSVMVQIGVVSWGTGCARPNKPGVYTRVTAYLDWIEEVVGTLDTCA